MPSIVIALAAFAAQDAAFRCDDPPFSFRLPAGHAEEPGPDADVVHFSRRPVAGGDVRIAVTRLTSEARWALPKPDKYMMLRQRHFPRDAQAADAHPVWKGLPLEAVEITWLLDGTRFMLTRFAIPLSPHSIEIELGGPDAEARADLHVLLESLDGVTHYMPHEEVMRRMKLAGIPGVAAMGAALIYAIVWVVCYRGRPARATWVRVAWLAAIGLLFATAAVFHAVLVPAGFFSDLEMRPPLIATPSFGLSLSAFYVGLAVLRMVLGRAAARSAVTL